jgi:hypothetical protein
MWRALYTILLAGWVAVPARAWQTLPLFFIVNQGQAPRAVRFMTKGAGVTAYFLRREVLLRAHGAWVQIRFEGACSSAHPQGSEPLPGRANFLEGRAGQWHLNVPLFGAVRYRDLYP